MLINRTCPRCQQAFKWGEAVVLAQTVYHVGNVHTEVTEKADQWVHISCPAPAALSEDRIKVQVAEPIFGAQVGERVLRTHGPDQCSGEFCCIHNPSDHPLKAAPLNWRGDRGLMERLCEHGIGHPDPDDLAHKRRTMPDYSERAWGTHGCDGCCTGRAA